MKKSLKWTGIVLIALIAVMMADAVVGLRQTLNLSIESADLNGIKDGVYTGSYDCYRWTHTAKVSVKDHKIADIQLISVPSGREDLAKKLSKAIVNQQKTDVDIISGATASSKAFLKAVQTALENGTFMP